MLGYGRMKQEAEFVPTTIDTRQNKRLAARDLKVTLEVTMNPGAPPPPAENKRLQVLPEHSSRTIKWYFRVFMLYRTVDCFDREPCTVPVLFMNIVQHRYTRFHATSARPRDVATLTGVHRLIKAGGSMGSATMQGDDTLVTNLAASE